MINKLSSSLVSVNESTYLCIGQRWATSCIDNTYEQITISSGHRDVGLRLSEVDVEMRQSNLVGIILRLHLQARSI